MSVLAGTQVQDTLLVTGGVPLSGEVQAGGSKNAALPLLAAAALPAGGTGLDNVPACADVQAMSGLLTEAGWPVQAGDSPGHVRVGSGRAWLNAARAVGRVAYPRLLLPGPGAARRLRAGIAALARRVQRWRAGNGPALHGL